MDSHRFISVVIPTYNRKPLLKLCLDALTVQTYPKSHYEVIVVDDGATDGTEDFIKEYVNKTIINIKYLKQENGGPARARNNGIRNAKGEFVVFTDDDCEADRNWLIEIVKGFTSEEVAGVGGMVISKHKDLLSQFIDHSRILLPPMENESMAYLVTANACYRRKVLTEVNGFTEEIKNPGGEDPDLSFKVKDKGYILKFNPDSIIYHHHKMDLRSFYNNAYNYGRGAKILWVKWGNRAVKNPPKTIFHLIRTLTNPRMLYGFYKHAGLKYAFPFWLLRSIRLFAWTRGFRKGY